MLELPELELSELELALELLSPLDEAPNKLRDELAAGSLAAMHIFLWGVVIPAVITSLYNKNLALFALVTTCLMFVCLEAPPIPRLCCCPRGSYTDNKELLRVWGILLCNQMHTDVVPRHRTPQCCCNVVERRNSALSIST